MLKTASCKDYFNDSTQLWQNTSEIKGEEANCWSPKILFRTIIINYRYAMAHIWLQITGFERVTSSEPLFTLPVVNAASALCNYVIDLGHVCRHGAWILSALHVSPPMSLCSRSKKGCWHLKTNSLWHSGSVAGTDRLAARVRAARVVLNPLFTASSIHRASRRRESVLTTVGKLSQRLQGKHGCGGKTRMWTGRDLCSKMFILFFSYFLSFLHTAFSFAYLYLCMKVQCNAPKNKQNNNNKKITNCCVGDIPRPEYLRVKFCSVKNSKMSQDTFKQNKKK